MQNEHNVIKIRPKKSQKRLHTKRITKTFTVHNNLLGYFSLLLMSKGESRALFPGDLGLRLTWWQRQEKSILSKSILSGLERVGDRNGNGGVP